MNTLIFIIYCWLIQISQLHHVISQKEALLQLYSQDQDGEDSSASPSMEAISLARPGGTYELLQQKLHTLEEENETLRQEVSEFVDLYENIQNIM